MSSNPSNLQSAKGLLLSLVNGVRKQIAEVSKPALTSCLYRQLQGRKFKLLRSPTYTYPGLDMSVDVIVVSKGPKGRSRAKQVSKIPRFGYS